MTSTRWIASTTSRNITLSKRARASRMFRPRRIRSTTIRRVRAARRVGYRPCAHRLRGPRHRRLVCYRSYSVHASVTKPPPVITADTSSTKIVPATVNDVQSAKAVQDRIANAGKEQIVSKQEEPVALKEIGTPTAPRVVQPAPVNLLRPPLPPKHRREAELSRTSLKRCALSPFVLMGRT